MSIFISQTCDAGCGIPRNKHSKKQREACSKIKKKLREEGKLFYEPINLGRSVSRLPVRSISLRHYSE